MQRRFKVGSQFGAIYLQTLKRSWLEIWGWRGGWEAQGGGISEVGGFLEVILLSIPPGTPLHSAASLRGGSPSPLLCPGAHCGSRPSKTSLPSSLLLESSFFMVSCFHSRIMSLPCFSCQIPYHGQQGFPSLGSRLAL